MASTTNSDTKPSRVKKGNSTTTTSGSSTTNTSQDTLALTRSINTITKNMQSFEKSVGECKQLIEEGLTDLEIRTTLKRKAMGELDEEYEHKKKSRKIDLEQDLRAHGFEEAVRILKEQKFTAIQDDELHKLKTELAEIKAEGKTQLESALNAERQRFQRDMEVFKTTSSLQNQTEVAKLTANVEKLQDHIKVLENTINAQKNDIDKQRELTKQVAESARPQPAFYPNNKNN